jgi:hypothetical protein
MILILQSKSEKSKKNLDFYYLVFCDLFLIFLPLKPDVNVPSKSNKQKNLLKNLFFCQPLTKKSKRPSKSNKQKKNFFV